MKVTAKYARVEGPGVPRTNYFARLGHSDIVPSIGDDLLITGGDGKMLLMMVRHRMFVGFPGPDPEVVLDLGDGYKDAPVPPFEEVIT